MTRVGLEPTTYELKERTATVALASLSIDKSWKSLDFAAAGYSALIVEHRV